MRKPLRLRKKTRSESKVERRKETVGARREKEERGERNLQVDGEVMSDRERKREIHFEKDQ